MIKNIVLSLMILSTVLFAADEKNYAEIMPKFKDSMYLGIKTNGTTIIAVGERGHVALSKDYGSTWSQAKSVPTRTTLTAVSMINNHAWAVGHDTTILYSSNSGESWEIQFEDKDRQMPLLDVLFINESEGFAVGAYGTYLTTYDGGKTWNDSLLSEDEDFHLNQIVKVDEFKYFVVAEAGKAYRSYDAGKNWESLDLPYSGSMFGVIKYKDELILYGLRGNVLVTNDFGSTFEQLDSPIQDSLFAGVHTFSNKIILVGANGAVLHYKNKSLSKIDIPNSNSDYTGVVSVKDNTQFFIGEAGITKEQIR